VLPGLAVAVVVPVRLEKTIISLPMVALVSSHLLRVPQLIALVVAVLAGGVLRQLLAVSAVAVQVQAVPAQSPELLTLAVAVAVEKPILAVVLLAVQAWLSLASAPVSVCRSQAVSLTQAQLLGLMMFIL
jgi:hypothetical protein